MSVTFSRGRRSINVGNVNAADFLDWVGIPRGEHGLVGSIQAKELAARCRRRLWPEKRNEGVEVPEVITRGDLGCTAHYFGRDAGYLPELTQRMLKMCEARSQESEVSWS